MKHDRKLSNSLCHKLNNRAGINMSARTVRRILRNNYVEICMQEAKTFKKNVEVDMQKCCVMLQQSPQERFDPYCTLKQTKQGSGSIGIWTCMNYAELGCYRLFEGQLNADRYIEILDNCLLTSINIFKEENNSTIYQQDGASCHTAKISKQ